jgi:hypothetical protein
MDPADIPLPKSPEEPEPSAPAAGLAASPTDSVGAQEPPSAFLVQLCRFVTAVFNLFAPALMFLFAAAYNKITTYPVEYRYSFLAISILVALTEWQQPGSISRPQYLSNAAVGFVCALSLAFGVVVMLDYIETARWPWEEDGWVWPWQTWLWRQTAYDLGASTNTQVDGFASPLPPATPATKPSPPTPTFGSPTAQTMSNTPANNSTAFNFSMPPPAIIKQTMIIPPIPQLPGGLRPVHLPPPTPAQVHRSGVLGESPMPPKFKHFSGDGFNKRQEKLKAVAEWASAGTSISLQGVRKNVPSILSEKRAAEESEDEKTAKKAMSKRDWIAGGHGGGGSLIEE